ncbi:DUF418 domain-containing protein [Robertkochia solimangrovi]|uniref:DUF418 domain-containing protein n=1 Tax=Robertkochia solimangrovi TaxID=2213046 RepID=UPI00117F81E4|nr:DUF5009 domain-containing protein [Robertkochia solimangrovi]TRZ43178.1 DUF5009 domain-containing protein [Robertkochia solimangrovi]
MHKSSRILSIDIMRGLTLFLMLFVNDLFVPGVPKWMVHTKATEDGMGLADWVFPGFLFMVGLSIPFAFMARRKKGDSDTELVKHIIIRTISLLVIGVITVNIPELNAELTGMGKYLWACLAYFCILLIWNTYPVEKVGKLTVNMLKGIGWLGLFGLAIIYRSGTPDDPSFISTRWWGILGLIGWGYFAAATTYLLTKGKLWGVVGTWIFFIGLNMLSQMGLTDFTAPVAPILGVLLDGNTPSIVLCGLVIGIILKEHRQEPEKLLKFLLPIGILVLLSGFVLRQWFIISKIMGTPSWAMVCNGISILLFALMFYLIDRKGIRTWAQPFVPAGQNSLTTYLAPDILYFIIWGFGFPILFYKQTEYPWLAVFGSLVWAFAMIGFAAFLSRIHIRLKL